MAAKGQFVCYKTAKGYWNYRLKASNKETIAVSGGTGYSSFSACKAGIESVRRNTGAKIEDQTLQKFEQLTNPKFEIYMDKAGKYRYRLKASNGELICTSEDGYASKDSCKKGIASLAKWAAEAEVVKEE
ncbi:MAG TPA: DUF1508 domain-containing protein [Candidatus Ornithoclostridium faecigallinarum]|nr:DUF1508 domain-containing protein [Candidatus Ornithoclostridium faecigallinarum]